MCEIKCAVFDLDGTLNQSEEGIFKCTQYALQEMHLPPLDEATLRKFIGPPLGWSFKEYCGMSEEEAEEALRLYRVRYNDVGLFENCVYPGVRRLLRTLKRQGWYVAMATGKPEIPARRIMKYFRLDKYFDRMVGTGEHMGADKEQLIRTALPEKWDTAWMIGDRKFDVEGGRAVGIHTIGVGYGYGTEAELREAGCEAYAETVQDVIDILCPGAPVPEGYFVSMEGLDGSGKTTQIDLLTEGLTRFGFEVQHSREPGGCPVAEEIRKVILDRNNKDMEAVAEAYLYAASRAQHVRQVIRPALSAGKLLLCDRFVDSSVAYQGGGRKLGVDRVLNINASAVDGTLPTATVYLELDHVTALMRRCKATEPDRIEMETEQFHARVEKAYHELIDRDPARFVVVDAARDKETIAAAVLAGVLDKLTEAEA